MAFRYFVTLRFLFPPYPPFILEVVSLLRQSRLAFLMGSKDLILEALHIKHSTPKDLHESTGLAKRTVSFRLKQLRQEGLVDCYCNFHDMRQPIYFLTELALVKHFSRSQHLPRPPPKT